MELPRGLKSGQSGKLAAKIEEKSIENGKENHRRFSSRSLRPFFVISAVKSLSFESH